MKLYSQIGVVITHKFLIFFRLKSKHIKALSKGLLYLKLKKNQINGKQHHG